ncbi:hypothetical protein D3C73_1143970 [compost metagenome]
MLVAGAVVADGRRIQRTFRVAEFHHDRRVGRAVVRESGFGVGGFAFLFRPRRGVGNIDGGGVTERDTGGRLQCCQRPSGIPSG